MADYEEYLRSAGLPKRGAAVYVALLQAGVSSPSEISRTAKVKRSTVYNIIEELERAGLVAEVPREKRKKYVALSPERVVERLKTKTEEVQRILPELLALHGGAKEKPRVSLYDDEAGMASVYEEITHASEKNICAFLSLDSVPKQLWKQAFDRFVELYSRPNMKVRELIFTRDENHPYLKKVFAISNYRGKIVATPFFTDSIIYGDKVALFSFSDKFALVIQSKTIADSIRSLFELAWSSPST